MRRLLVIAAVAVTAALAAAPSQAATPVTWDKYSLRIENRPVFVNAGEVHPNRMPGGPAQWRRVLRTLKAAGLDTISIYVFWQDHEIAPGRFRFDGVWDVERFMREARDAGLDVIARIGPYVQGEVDGGGYPWWTLGKPGIHRTGEPEFTADWKRWFAAVLPRLARWQAGGANRGTMVALQVENEHPGGGAEETEQSRAYMRDLVQTAKGLGIEVPITHNDVQLLGQERSRGHFLDLVDVFGFDNYPYGFACCADWNEETFRRQVDTFEDYYRDEVGVQRSPLYAAEIQGGLIAFADDGHTTEDRYRHMIGYEYVQTISLLGQGLTMINRYMTYGGTTWGNQVYPNAGTGYDYGAPVREWGALGTRYDELRRIGLQIRAAGGSIARTERVDAPEGVYRMRRSVDDGTLHVFLRNADPGVERDTPVTIDGRTTPPVPLPGHSARWLLARANLSGWRIDLTSAEVAHADKRFLVLFGDRGRPYSVWIAGRRFDFKPAKHPRILRLGKRTLVIMSRSQAARVWKSGTRLVVGPLLLMGSTVETSRRTRTTTIARGSVKRRTLEGPARVKVPRLSDWRRRAETPERQPAFDDSAWPRLEKLSTHNQVQPNTSPVLGSDDNGVPGSGFIWYRGRYSGPAGELCLEGRHRYHVWLNGRSLGTVTSAAEVPGPMGLGGLGASPPVPQPARLALPADAQTGGENVIAVLVESWGHNMDAGGAIQAKNPRGLISASLDRPGAPPCGWTLGPAGPGGEFSTPLAAGTYSTAPGLPKPSGGIDWRIHGAAPEDYPNTSGLHGEGAGWHRGGFDDSSWERVSLPRETSSGPGEVAWYRTRFRLSVPRGHYAAFGLDLPKASFPANVYLNGVQIARAGRDREERFYLPAGVLRERGENTLAIARWNVGESARMDAPALHLYERRRVARLP
ncbi:MAG TPA: beta-galactosidase [Thermoleophilaceae bacterium]|jgi:beta-galactosidase